MEFTSEGSRFYQNDHILTCTADAFIRSGVYSGLRLPFQKSHNSKNDAKLHINRYLQADGPAHTIDINLEL